MVRANIKKVFYCDKDRLWDIIINNYNYSWRSDISKIEVIDEEHFIEYTKNNYPTKFTITSKIKLEKYEFDLENSNIKGKWTGLFREVSDGKIELDFTEEIEVKNFLMKLLTKLYLKSQQKRYMKDLESEVNRKL